MEQFEVVNELYELAMDCKHFLEDNSKQEKFQVFVLDYVMQHVENEQKPLEERVKFLDQLCFVLEQDLQLLRALTFDIIPPLLKQFQQISSLEIKHRITKLILLFGKYASAKEMHSILLDQMSPILFSVENFTTYTNTIKLIVQTLQLSLPRIERNRFPFFSSAFPLILSKTKSIIVLPEQQHEKSETILLAENQLFLQLLPTLLQFIHPFLYPFETIRYAQLITNEQQKREYDQIVGFLLFVLSKLYSIPTVEQSLKEEATAKIMMLFEVSHTSFYYIVSYAKRYTHFLEKKRQVKQDLKVFLDALNDHEGEEDLEEVRQLEQRIIGAQWDFYGVGIVAYLGLVKKKFSKSFSEELFDAIQLFKLCKIYVEKMMQSGIHSIALIGKSFAQSLIKPIKLNSISISQQSFTEMEYYFSWIQALINFVCYCPDNSERTSAYHLLNDTISRFDNSSKFALLKEAIQICPFATLVSLLILRLKEEIRLEYDSFLQIIKRPINVNKPYQPIQPNQNTTDTMEPPKITLDQETQLQLKLRASQSVFITPQSIELLLTILPKYIFSLKQIDSTDVVIQSLNLIYYLLLKDSQANMSGIANSTIQERITKQVILPLEQQLHSIYSSINSIPIVQNKQAATEEEDLSYIEQLTDEQLDALLEEEENTVEEEETEHEMQITKLRYSMLEEVLHRVKETIN